MKDSLVLHTEHFEQIEVLNMEQRGILLTAIMSYQTGGAIPEMDAVTKMCFMFIRQRIDRDNESYQARCKKNADNARKRWDEKEDDANACDRISTDANGCERMRTDARENVRIISHSDNDPDNDTDNDSLKKSISYEIPKEKPQRFFPPTPEEVRAYASEKGYTNVDADRFCDFYDSKGWVVGKTKMKDWKAAVRNWHRSQREEAPKAVRQETTAKRTRFVNYDQRQVDYDAMLREGDWR